MAQQPQSLLFNFEDFVRITNRSNERIEGRYAGVDFVWEALEPGQEPVHDIHSLDVQKVVATHIFGWLDPAKTYTQKDALEIRERAMLRLAWIDPSDRQPMKRALAKLRNITIGPLPPFQNVRMIRGSNDYSAPAIEVLPEGDSEPGTRVPPPLEGSGNQSAAAAPPPTPLVPEDPQANLHKPRRVEPVGKK